MRDVARRALLAVASAMMLAGLGVSGVVAQAPDAEAEVRITARRLADGRTEFALQARAAGESWGERRLPRARFFPASPAVGRWLSSSVLTIEVSALAAHSAEGAESVEVRIVARRLADGRTEFALQERAAGDSWGERRLPRSRFFPASPPVGLWLSSWPLTVGAAVTAPVASEPPTIPEITTIQVSPGDDIQIVIVGGTRPASCNRSYTEDGETTCLEWGLSAAERRDFVTAEMANIASFFVDRFGYAPPAEVTVLLDHNRLFVHQAFVGSIVTSFSSSMPTAVAANVLAHEYYHVLQYALTPFESLYPAAQGGPFLGGTPRWLVEGSATYVAALYDGTLADERRAQLLGHHSNTGTLRAGTADDYDVGMLAVDWLTEHAGEGALVEYWRELNRAPLCRTVGECARPTAVTWADPFEAVFGLTPDAFYDRFEAYRREAVRSAGIPHLADDVAEPVITTAGDVSDAIVAMAADELARLQSFSDRLGADPVDYTLVLADGESYPDAIRRLMGDRPEGWCSTSLTSPPHRTGLVIDTSSRCTAARAADGGHMASIADFHLTLTVRRLTTFRDWGRSPFWLDRGISAYAAHHYEALTGRRTGRTVDRAAALRSTRTLGPLRDQSTSLDVRDHWEDVTRLGFLAAEWLADHAGETALLDFYRERHVSPSWQAAFEAAFGLTPDAFYAEFERYRATLR